MLCTDTGHSTTYFCLILMMLMLSYNGKILASPDPLRHHARSAELPAVRGAGGPHVARGPAAATPPPPTRGRGRRVPGGHAAADRGARGGRGRGPGGL